jgi:hypothetical protein
LHSNSWYDLEDELELMNIIDDAIKIIKLKRKGEVPCLSQVKK